MGNRLYFGDVSLTVDMSVSDVRMRDGHGSDRAVEASSAIAPCQIERV